MHFHARIDHALLDVFAQPIRAAGVEDRLAPFQDSPIHGLIGGPRHGSRVVAFHEILHSLSVHQDVVAEEIEVDGRLVQMRRTGDRPLPGATGDASSQ
jgi:hypothetical protein